MRDVREWTAPLVRFVGRHRDPVLVQTLRSATAATIAYVVALRLSPEPAPLTAPLTALLVVQVTLYATLTNGIRRVNAVVAGVLVAIAFSLLVGLTWWSLALLIVASLVVGRLMRRMGEEAAGRTPVDHATARLHEARRLDHDIVEVDAALRQAEDSLRLNPRVREGLLHRVVLRTGLDTLEICTVVLRVLARTFTDLAKQRDPEPLFAPPTGAAVEQLLSEIGDAVVSFAVLVTTDVSVSAESAESRLSAELHTAAATRDKLAQLLLEEVQRDAAQWQLLGAMLTEVNRMLDELDTEHRSRRLLEELDRCTSEQRERLPWLIWLRERVGVPERLRRNRGTGADRSR
ncbi:aromatic acid exporter family protein [Streptomyces sp. MBT62]|uniref:FUSC family protein n=1 Tax=Streptomyces sp. MBT62 TaxID=2800410 RepID=UPI00190CCE7C|nr:aromatic acid exporter family protein [Streptomyces sp. MBT62]MBK3563788.1 hypothetical protein [Streptomyces sp. MBT62]